MKRALVGVALAMASAGTATAGPTPTTLEMTLQPGQRLVMTMGQVPRGEFGFTLRATGTGAKNFVLSQQRVGSSRRPGERPGRLLKGRCRQVGSSPVGGRDDGACHHVADPLVALRGSNCDEPEQVRNDERHAVDRSQERSHEDRSRRRRLSWP